MFDITFMEFLILLCVNLIIIITMVYNTRWNKCMDITNHYMLRYDALMKERLDINLKYNKIKPLKNNKIEIKEKKNEIKSHAENWWDRFWTLQQEQHHFWKKGCIHNDFFDLWMNYREREFFENYLTGGISIQQGWILAKNSSPYPDDFIEKINNIIIKAKMKKIEMNDC